MIKFRQGGIEYDDVGVFITSSSIRVSFWVDTGEGLTNAIEEYPSLESFKEDWEIVDQ